MKLEDQARYKSEQGTAAPGLEKEDHPSANVRDPHCEKPALLAAIPFL